MPRSISRRSLLGAALAGAGLAVVAPRALCSPAQDGAALQVGNITGLHTVKVARIETPRSTADVRRALLHWPGRIAVGGGRYSMGGQTAVAGGLHLDMRGMNQLVWLRPQEQTVRVQAGMRWRDLLDHIDGHGLAVRTMQSYSNFTVGGAVSVNAHGRYMGHGPVGHSVRALQLVLANGCVVEASRQRHPALFSAALGGYGGVGVVTEVELQLDRNSLLERHIAEMPLADYPAWFARSVRPDPACVLHNADLLPPHFDRATAISWRTTQRQATSTERLIPRGRSYPLERAAIWAATLPGGDALQREVLRPALQRRPAVVWRNHQASLDLRMLEPADRRSATYALQEYFVPVPQLLPFAAQMAHVLQAHGAQVLNVSIRHSPADADGLLAWAREEVFSLVIYYRQGTGAQAQDAVGVWTRALIDAALACGGSYYLPYQLHATRAQFEAAYPQADAFRAVKRELDPQGRLSNTLWDRYI
ncbi:FAD-binding oxidoreductase [Xylophilus sp. GW821-FHT01B05]